MKIKIDGKLCTGHGRCWTLSPSVYEADAEGYNSGRDTVIAVGADDEDAAVRGMRSCPERAISVLEDQEA